MAVRVERARSFGLPALAATLVAGALLLAACAPRVAVPALTSTAARDGAAMSGAGRPSPACLAPAPRPLPEQLVVNGQPRRVLVHAPAVPGHQAVDLVIAFHGRTNDAARARRYFGLDAALPEALIAYPQALPTRPGAFSWGDPGDPPDGLRDFALVEAIVDAFGRTRCVDLDRVFVVGHSLGAYFANDVACALGDRVRAVASVAGGLQGGGCAAGTAALLLHHPDDPLVPLSAGARARDAFRAANGLSETVAMPASEPALTPLRCVRYGGADTPDPVVWCAHDDATWPGGRYDPHTWPDAAPAAIAAFFRQLP